MKKLSSKTLKSLGISKKLFRKKAFVLQHTDIEKVEIFHVLHNKVALLLRRRSKRGTRNHHQIIFSKVWTIYIENAGQKKDEFFMILIKLRLFLQIFLDILEFIWWSLHSSFLFINIG